MPLAIRYVLLSALGFALMTACVKQAALLGIPVFEIVAARALVSLLISYLDIRRKGISPWGKEKGLLFARGLAGTLALICVYYAVTTLPLAEAVVLQYTYPVFTAIIAWLFLRESIQRATILCIVLSLFGLGIMVQPTEPQIETLQQTLPWLSVLAGLLGALGSAIAYVLVRRLGRSEDSAVIIFYFPLIALPISLLLLGGNFVIPSGHALLVLLLVGIFTQIGQIGLTKAMTAEKAGKVGAYSYIQVVFSAALGFFIFAEFPSFNTILGASLIIGGALINALSKR
ncbi:MAG: DMT family transporter [Xanthomonadales bacterium]|nr:DMT family transporter [Xanthomonadales bacterium]